VRVGGERRLADWATSSIQVFSREIAMSFFRKLIATDAPSAVILVRLIVGAVFLSEGIQKFLFPAALGPGRFAKIGFATPEFTAYFVAIFEITCGSLILIGLLTRLAVVPTTIIMLVSIWTTKVPILHVDGFWKMAHEARTDYAMLLGSIFLLIVGAGVASVDRCLGASPQREPDAAHGPVRNVMVEPKA
jgi:putative oxidoreductase